MQNERIPILTLNETPVSLRQKELILDRIVELEAEADNARVRRDFKALASFRFLAILSRDQLASI